MTPNCSRVRLNSIRSSKRPPRQRHSKRTCCARSSRSNRGSIRAPFRNARAIGLMQLMPATAMRFGVSNAFDPRQNVRAGAQYLKFLIERFDNDLSLALAAYNAGEQAVDRNGGQIPPYMETQAYVPRVLKIYRMLAKQARES